MLALAAIYDNRAEARARVQEIDSSFSAQRHAVPKRPKNPPKWRRRGVENGAVYVYGLSPRLAMGPRFRR